MMCEPELAIVGILRGIIIQLGKVLGEERTQNKNFTNALLKVGKIGAIGTANILGRFAGLNRAGSDLAGAVKNVNDEADQGSGNPDIADLKEEIRKLIDEILTEEHKRKNKKGFLFFIDDLDRIDPPVAVKILELLKNIFDLKNCVFVLAIDYDVVIKGLKPKFGEMTAQNEREFRSFFDKIIQLPFAMPVSSYRIDKFLVDALTGIEFLTAGEAKDTKLTTELSELAQWSVDSNPRSLKRLTNTLSLIQLIAEATQGKDDDGEKDFPGSKSINFALVCMQICYPAVYNALIHEPDFLKWNETLAKKLSLQSLTDEEKRKLEMQDEFDEEWEQTLFRLCLKDYFLSSRVLDISRMLNKISALIPPEENAGEIVASVIRLSAVTNVQSGAQSAENKPIEFHRSHWLKTHRNHLLPKVNALLADWGKLIAAGNRVQSVVHYRLEQSNKNNRSGYNFKITHNGKQFILHLDKGFSIFEGASSTDFAMEEAAINQTGTFQKIKSELSELKEKYGATHDMNGSINLGGGYSYVWFNFAYDTLEEAVSAAAIQRYAEFFAEYAKITDQYALIHKAASYGQFNQLHKFCKNNGISPFTKLWIYNKTTLVIDAMPYQGASLSFDLTMRQHGFYVQLWARTGDKALVVELMEKTGLSDSLPNDVNGRWCNEIPFEEIENFIAVTLGKLSSI